MLDTYVIVPVYNEASVIGGVIQELRQFFPNIVCVDDGSTDTSATEVKKTGATLLQHNRNKGQGAALRTGLHYVLERPNAQHFVTFDADGQHQVMDALMLIECLRHSGLDIVLGSRFLGNVDDISWAKKLTLKLAIAFTNKTTGVHLTDTHNGLRAFNRRFAENLHLRCNGMAHASEIIYRVAEGKFKYGEMPVTISYTKYSKAKGQSIFNAFNILSELRTARKEVMADQAE